MVKSYRLTAQADADIEDIFFYTLQKWDLAQAEKYLGELDNYMNKLAAGKLQGKSCELLIPKARAKDYETTKLRYYHANKHYIIYLDVPSGIDVLTLYHDHMDLERRLDELQGNQP